MKITINQLRRIIKEEVKRSALREMPARKMPMPTPEPEVDGQIEIPNISMIADNLEMPLKKCVTMIKGVARKNAIVVNFEGPQGEGDGYSAEYDSLLGYGSYTSLMKFAALLDNELMGGAQSIDDEDSFVNYVEEI